MVYFSKLHITDHLKVIVIDRTVNLMLYTASMSSKLNLGDAKKILSTTAGDPIDRSSLLFMKTQMPDYTVHLPTLRMLNKFVPF